MKKHADLTRRTLQLHSTTIRNLEVAALEAVAGGATTNPPPPPTTLVFSVCRVCPLTNDC